MKIANLDFKDYAVQKPVSISETGRFVSVNEVVAQPSLSLISLYSLGFDLQLKLALERYRLEPDFKLGVVGVGIFSKEEVLEHLEQQTEFGKSLLAAEMGYLNEFLASLPTAKVQSWPEIPGPTKVEPFPWKEWPPFQRKKPCIWVKMQTRAVFCENTTDIVTTPFANYRKRHVHPVFNTVGFKVISLEGTDDVRANFAPLAKNGLTVYLSGIGHGSYAVYTGHMGNRILEVCSYDPAEVADKAIHFLSCQTASQLGPDTIKKGAKSYTGYTENFRLVWDDGTTPAVDEFELFAKSDSTFDIMMAKGSTAKQAYDITVQAFNAAISMVPNTISATLLTWDRNHLKLHGKETAKILPYRSVKICFPLVDLEKQDALVTAGTLVD